MNIKLLSAALGLTLTAGVITAHAQKTYTSGVASFSMDVRGQPADAMLYFSPDSSAMEVTFGAGSFKALSNAKHTYFAVVLDIPVAGIKKAGISTPAELEEGVAAYPTFTFSPTSETKVISGFNCKKVIATNSKDKKTYAVWITNDVVVPTTGYPFYYSSIGGYPIEFTLFQPGQGDQDITVKSISATPAPAGTFGIASDFEKGTMADLMQQ